jgi:glycosyltransferase involved in cell wall biosynthesis
MDAIEVVGPFRGSSGYDRHTREFVRRFVGMGVRVQLHHLDGWSAPLPERARERCFEELQAPVGAGVLLHFTMPNHARPRAGMRNINYTMFEADRIPAAWAARAADHDCIVVPTASSRAAWVNRGIDPSRVRVSGLGVDAEFFAAGAPPLDIGTADGRSVASFRHRFLNVAELRPRKNHLGLLRCWIRATRPDDDAVLLLKTTANARELEMFRADLAEMQRRLGSTFADAAPVVFLPLTLRNEEMRALYKSATHYLSLSKGEGWDQVMMEAAVAGLRPIAPRHSAYVEYLTDDDAELIDAALTPAVFEGKLHDEDRLFFDGVQWWQPDEEKATDLIRHIIAGKAPKPSPGERIARDYSWDAAARSLLQILNNPQ